MPHFFPRMAHFSYNVTHFSQTLSVTHFFQVWHIFPSVIHFSECAHFFPVWPIFPVMWPIFSRYLVWPIFPSVTHCSKFAQFSKCDAFFKVQPIFPSVTKDFSTCDPFFSIMWPSFPSVPHFQEWLIFWSVTYFCVGFLRLCQRLRYLFTRAKRLSRDFYLACRLGSTSKRLSVFVRQPLVWLLLSSVVFW